MVHVSEISDGYLSSPNDVLSIGQEVSVWVIKFDRRKRQIDLTMKAPQQYEQVEEEEEKRRTADGDGDRLSPRSEFKQFG